MIASGIHNIQGQSQGMTNDGLRSTSDVSITQHWNLLNQPLLLEYPQGNVFPSACSIIIVEQVSLMVKLFFFSLLYLSHCKQNTYRQSHDEQGWMISNHFSVCTHNQCEENVLQANETEEVQI